MDFYTDGETQPQAAPKPKANPKKKSGYPPKPLTPREEAVVNSGSSSSTARGCPKDGTGSNIQGKILVVEPEHLISQLLIDKSKQVVRLRKTKEANIKVFVLGITGNRWDNTKWNNARRHAPIMWARN